jgi:hypothetical protein
MDTALPTMRRALLVTGLLLVTTRWCSGSMAFRNCDPSQDSSAFRGSSHYFVGELEFDEDSGATLGTETHFNYSNLDSSGVVECHVTYEITGVYEPASALFLLEANRSGHSRGCDSAFIESNYPESNTYTLHAEFKANGSVEMLRADSGETVGVGTWITGAVSYKTEETCELH